MTAGSLKCAGIGTTAAEALASTTARNVLKPMPASSWCHLVGGKARQESARVPRPTRVAGPQHVCAPTSARPPRPELGCGPSPAEVCQRQRHVTRGAAAQRRRTRRARVEGRDDFCRHAEAHVRPGRLRRTLERVAAARAVRVARPRDVQEAAKGDVSAQHQREGARHAHEAAAHVRVRARGVWTLATLPQVVGRLLGGTPATAARLVALAHNAEPASAPCAPRCDEAVCARARACARARVCACACVCARARACVRARVRVCVCVCVCVHVCIPGTTWKRLSTSHARHLVCPM